MQGSRLDFMKRKEVKHTAERVGGKGEQQQQQEEQRGRARGRSGGGGLMEEGLMLDGII